MDTKTQPAPTQENGAKIEESSSDPPGEGTKGKEDATKTNKSTRQTRSQTPQTLKEKQDDKSKKAELLIKISQSTGENVNGHSEKNADSSETKGNKKEEQKDEKPKKQDDSKRSKSSDSKDNKKKDTSETTKKVDHEDDKKTAVDSEKKKSESSPKKHDKKESSKQSTSKDDAKKPTSKETNTVESESTLKSNDAEPKPEGEGVDMDPLILATDEPDPELLFDETSDLESGKGSPIQSRCKTRRSHTRNIPTPKTPKSADSESEKNSVPPTPIPENLNDTNDSLNVGDVSTRAEVGSDVTRLDYIAHDSTLGSATSYLNYSRDRSLRETLQSLSARKTIRPLNDAFRKRAFRNNRNKSDLNVPYSQQDSINRVTGIKRKRSSTPEDRKKFKPDSSAGFLSYLSNPLTNFKNRFVTDSDSSSTPKLTGYKDSRKDIHEDVNYTEIVSESSEKKNSLCAIM